MPEENKPDTTTISNAILAVAMSSLGVKLDALDRKIDALRVELSDEMLKNAVDFDDARKGELDELSRKVDQLLARGTVTMPSPAMPPNTNERIENEPRRSSATLRITGAPVGSTIRSRGRVFAHLAQETTFDVPPGESELSVEAAGFKSGNFTINAKPGEEHFIELVGKRDSAGELVIGFAGDPGK